MRATCASREPDQPAIPAEEVVADGVRACCTRNIPYLVATYIYIYRIRVFSCYARYSEEGSYCPPRGKVLARQSLAPRISESLSLVDLEPNRMLFKDLSNVDV